MRRRDDLPAVLHLGPDVRGGMTAARGSLLASPLSERYRQLFVPTHRGPGPVRRLAVFLLALLRLTVWSARGQGRIVHIHATVRGSMYRKAVCVLIARALRRRVVLQVHSGPGDIAGFRARLDRFSAALFALAFRVADVVMAVSSASAAALADAFGATDVIVVPNAAPAVAERSLRRPGPGRAPTAVYLGGFANRVKGGSVLLEALARPELAELHAVLAGPGELPETGRRLLAARAALEWRGWLDASEKDELLRTADIFVIASTSEGLPMALLEALSLGLAIVATEVGGVPDVVEPEVSAIVVPPGDPAALASGLARLAADPALRERLGGAARERARSFSAELIAERIDAVYRRLL
ncbi:MAG TPA: glycosyltransferase family 4 protein [Solirubrobacterales bacterium]|nr:glycosyltransferase family 4 protein [Solirubrobacterales bacterium]